MSDADAWEDWLRAGAGELSLTDDGDDAEAAVSGLAGLAGLDDPWGELEIALEPLTDDQRAHLARATRPPAAAEDRADTSPDGAARTDGADPFEALDEIDEIDEIDGIDG